jgi:hypothetical protein
MGTATPAITDCFIWDRTTHSHYVTKIPWILAPRIPNRETEQDLITGNDKAKERIQKEKGKGNRRY